MRLRSIVRGAAIMAAPLLAATPAGAATTSDYTARMDATYSYASESRSPTTVALISTEYRLVAQVPRVSFRDGDLVSADAGSSTISALDARLDGEYHAPSGTITGSCAGTRGGPLGAATVDEGLSTPLDGGSQMVVRPFQVLNVDLTCAGPMSLPSGLALADVDEPGLGYGPFDLVFDLPPDATAQGKIVQLVSREVTGDHCPLHNDYTVDCSLRIDGTVTFTRTSQHTDPGAAPDLESSDDPALLTPLVPGRNARLTHDARSAVLTLGCRADCGVVARAYAARGKGATAAGRRPIATRRVTLAAGRAQRLTVRFGRTARRAIRRTGAVRIDLSVTPRGGGPSEKQSVRLRVSPAQAA